MTQQIISYNQIDFVVKAPRFRIVFSYMDDKGVAFVREYLLRLLKLTPCKPEQIAQYFGFNQHETEIALSDLERNRWIIWQDFGLITLSSEGLHLFQNSNKDTPKIPILKEFSGEYRMELLDNNFLHKKYSDSVRQQAIELDIEPKKLSESSETTRKTFQNRFRQLIEEAIIEVKNEMGEIEKDISLYKIDAIEPKGSPHYFRFTQSFELLAETGKPKERHDLENLIHQDNIQQAITTKLEQFSFGNNLREIRNSIDELRDDDMLKILFSGRLDFAEFLKVYQKYKQQNCFYFLGQIYHQEPVFQKINLILDKLDKNQSKKFYWLAPSDIYWGKQRKVHDKIQNIIGKQKHGYEFRLYLPISEEKNTYEKQKWQQQFRGISDEVIYGFCEGFLNGNTEVIFLEDTFAVVCYHVKFEGYPVTLPIGVMTTKVNEINLIKKLVETYLASFLEAGDLNIKDFGLLHRMGAK